MRAVDRSRLPGLGPDPVFRFPTIDKTRLSNGLSVWTVEHCDLPMVALLLLVPVGSSADPPARPGLAALTADLLDESSGGRSTIEVHEALARIGAQFDLEIGSDATVLSLTTLARFSDRALALIAGMVASPAFDVQDFSRVRELRLHRLAQLRDLAPAVAERVFAETIYRGHPYGHLAIGDEESLRAVALDEVVAFHRRFFGASGATLIAVGDVSHQEVVRSVDAQFAAWWAQDLTGGAAEVQLPAVPQPVEKLVLVNRPAAAQSELRIGHVAVQRATPDYHALLVLNMILGGQFVSRINLNLREDKGYTYGARSSFDFRRDRGPFIVQASVQTDATAASVREIFAEIAGIRGERAPTTDELVQAKAALTRGYPRNFETAEQIARAVSQLALYGLADDYFSQFGPRVAAVDSDTVLRVARTHVDLGRLTTVIVGDRDKVGASLESLQLGAPVEVAAR